jgi:integrase
MQVAVDDGVEVDNFLDSLKSPRTKELYSLHRKRFLKFVGRKSIIVNETGGSNNNNLADATQEIVRYLKKLKDDGISYSYRNNALAAIKHDYIMNGDDARLVLNWTKIAKFLGENERKYEIRGYTHDEIRRMVDIADIKYKAVILMLASTGMRRDALVNIELRDLEYLKEPYNLYKIKIYKKSESEQLCFTTPEAAEAIKLYVSKRPGAKYFHNVRSKAISTALTKLAIRAGIVQRGIGRGKSHRNEIPAAHGLRKFCITQMARAKVDTEVAKLLTGHSIGVRGRYLNYSEDDLLQEYLKAVDLLTINEANRLRKKVSVLEEKEQEIQSLREQIRQFQQEGQQVREEMKEMRRDFIETPPRRTKKGGIKGVNELFGYLEAHPEFMEKLLENAKRAFQSKKKKG